MMKSQQVSLACLAWVKERRTWDIAMLGMLRANFFFPLKGAIIFLICLQGMDFDCKSVTGILLKGQF